ncbi:MAG: DUF2219 family protein, partial [Candidatus Omnitrophica bacterium]|nr:DUF2219 family protein [Candidatus Omnitrophota bacterium]
DIAFNPVNNSIAFLLADEQPNPYWRQFFIVELDSKKQVRIVVVHGKEAYRRPGRHGRAFDIDSKGNYYVLGDRNGNEAEIYVFNQIGNLIFTQERLDKKFINGGIAIERGIVTLKKHDVDYKGQVPPDMKKKIIRQMEIVYSTVKPAASPVEGREKEREEEKIAGQSQTLKISSSSTILSSKENCDIGGLDVRPAECRSWDDEVKELLAQRDVRVREYREVIQTLGTELFKRSIGRFNLFPIIDTIKIIFADTESDALHILVYFSEEMQAQYPQIVSKLGKVVGWVDVALVANIKQGPCLIIAEVQPANSYWYLSAKEKRIIKDWHKALFHHFEEIKHRVGIREILKVSNIQLKAQPEIQNEIRRLIKDKGKTSLPGRLDEFYGRPSALYQLQEREILLWTNGCTLKAHFWCIAERNGDVSILTRPRPPSRSPVARSSSPLGFISRALGYGPWAKEGIRKIQGSDAHSARSPAVTGKGIRKVINKLTAALPLFFIWLFVSVFPAFADTTFVFQFENDCFMKRDANYSNGLKVGLLSSYLPDLPGNSLGYNLLRKIMPEEDASRPRLKGYKEFSLGQNIYTPDNGKEFLIVEGEHPYAGISYLEWAWHIIPDNSRQHSLVLDLGLVGPYSFAEQTQKIAHAVLGDNRHNGWDNQMVTEPLALISYGYKQRAWDWNLRGDGAGYGSDLILHGGIGLGNFRTYANAGGELRFGLNLANDFGTLLNRPGRGALGIAPHSADSRYPSVYGFAGVDLQAVFYDITLDGGLISRSPYTVERKPLVLNLIAGVAIKFKSFEVVFAGIRQTERFTGQDKPHQYGSLTIVFPLGRAPGSPSSSPLDVFRSSATVRGGSDTLCVGSSPVNGETPREALTSIDERKFGKSHKEALLVFFDEVMNKDGIFSGFDDDEIFKMANSIFLQTAVKSAYIIGLKGAYGLIKSPRNKRLFMAERIAIHLYDQGSKNNNIPYLELARFGFERIMAQLADDKTSAGELGLVYSRQIGINDYLTGALPLLHYFYYRIFYMLADTVYALGLSLWEKGQSKAFFILEKAIAYYGSFIESLLLESLADEARVAEGVEYINKKIANSYLNLLFLSMQAGERISHHRVKVNALLASFKVKDIIYYNLKAYLNFSILIEALRAAEKYFVDGNTDALKRNYLFSKVPKTTLRDLGRETSQYLFFFRKGLEISSVKENIVEEAAEAFRNIFTHYGLDFTKPAGKVLPEEILPTISHYFVLNVLRGTYEGLFDPIRFVTRSFGSESVIGELLAEYITLFIELDKNEVQGLFKNILNAIEKENNHAEAKKAFLNFISTRFALLPPMADIIKELFILSGRDRMLLETIFQLGGSVAFDDWADIRAEDDKIIEEYLRSIKKQAATKRQFQKRAAAWAAVQRLVLSRDPDCLDGVFEKIAAGQLKDLHKPTAEFIKETVLSRTIRELRILMDLKEWLNFYEGENLERFRSAFGEEWIEGAIENLLKEGIIVARGVLFAIEKNAGVFTISDDFNIEYVDNELVTALVRIVRTTENITVFVIDTRALTDIKAKEIEDDLDKLERFIFGGSAQHSSSCVGPLHGQVSKPWLEKSIGVGFNFTISSSAIFEESIEKLLKEFEVFSPARLSAPPASLGNILRAYEQLLMRMASYEMQEDLLTAEQLSDKLNHIFEIIPALVTSGSDFSIITKVFHRCIGEYPAAMTLFKHNLTLIDLSRDNFFKECAEEIGFVLSLLDSFRKEEQSALLKNKPLFAYNYWAACLIFIEMQICGEIFLCRDITESYPFYQRQIIILDALLGAYLPFVPYVLLSRAYNCRGFCHLVSIELYWRGLTTFMESLYTHRRAEADLKNALRINPLNSDARKNLVYLLRESKKIIFFNAVEKDKFYSLEELLVLADNRVGRKHRPLIRGLINQLTSLGLAEVANTGERIRIKSIKLSASYPLTASSSVSSNFEEYFISQVREGFSAGIEPVLSSVKDVKVYKIGDSRMPRKLSGINPATIISMLGACAPHVRHYLSDNELSFNSVRAGDGTMILLVRMMEELAERYLDKRFVVKISEDQRYGVPASLLKGRVFGNGPEAVEVGFDVLEGSVNVSRKNRGPLLIVFLLGEEYSMKGWPDKSLYYEKIILARANKKVDLNLDDNPETFLKKCEYGFEINRKELKIGMLFRLRHRDYISHLIKLGIRVETKDLSEMERQVIQQGIYENGNLILINSGELDLLTALLSGRLHAIVGFGRPTEGEIMMHTARKKGLQMRGRFASYASLKDGVGRSIDIKRDRQRFIAEEERILRDFNLIRPGLEKNGQMPWDKIWTQEDGSKNLSLTGIYINDCRWVEELKGPGFSQVTEDETVNGFYIGPADETVVFGIGYTTQIPLIKEAIERKGGAGRREKLLLKLAGYYSRLGLYKKSIEAIEQINKKERGDKYQNVYLNILAHQALVKSSKETAVGKAIKFLQKITFLKDYPKSRRLLRRLRHNIADEFRKKSQASNDAVILETAQGYYRKALRLFDPCSLLDEQDNLEFQLAQLHIREVKTEIKILLALKSGKGPPQGCYFELGSIRKEISELYTQRGFDLKGMDYFLRMQKAWKKVYAFGGEAPLRIKFNTAKAYFTRRVYKLAAREYLGLINPKEAFNLSFPSDSEFSPEERNRCFEDFRQGIYRIFFKYAVRGFLISFWLDQNITDKKVQESIFALEEDISTLDYLLGKESAEVSFAGGVLRVRAERQEFKLDLSRAIRKLTSSSPADLVNSQLLTVNYSSASPIDKINQERVFELNYNLNIIGNFRHRLFNFQKFSAKARALLDYSGDSRELVHWSTLRLLARMAKAVTDGNKHKSSVFGLSGEISGIYEVVIKRGSALEQINLGALGDVNQIVHMGNRIKEFDAVSSNTVFEFKFCLTLRKLFQQVIGIDSAKLPHLKVLTEDAKFSNIRNLVYFGEHCELKLIQAISAFIKARPEFSSCFSIKNNGFVFKLGLSEEKYFLVFALEKYFSCDLRKIKEMVNLLDKKIARLPPGGKFDVIIAASNAPEKELARLRKLPRSSSPLGNNGMLSCGPFLGYVNEKIAIFSKESAGRKTEKSLEKALSGYGYKRWLREILKVRSGSRKLKTNFQLIREDKEIFFTRAKDIFVIDIDYAERLADLNLSRGGIKIIWADMLKDMPRSLESSWLAGFQRWTVGCLLALQELDLRGKYVVDAGCGNAVLGLSALRLGAEKVYLLDSAKELKPRIETALSRNGFNSSRADFSYFGKRFEDLEHPGRLGEVDVLAANLENLGLSCSFENAKDPLRYLIDFFNPGVIIVAGDDRAERLWEFLKRTGYRYIIINTYSRIKAYMHHYERFYWLANENIATVLERKSSSPVYQQPYAFPYICLWLDTIQRLAGEGNGMAMIYEAPGDIFYRAIWKHIFRDDIEVYLWGIQRQVQVIIPELRRVSNSELIGSLFGICVLNFSSAFSNYCGPVHDALAQSLMGLGNRVLQKRIKPREIPGLKNALEPEIEYNDLPMDHVFLFDLSFERPLVIDFLAPAFIGKIKGTNELLKMSDELVSSKEFQGLPKSMTADQGAIFSQPSGGASPVSIKLSNILFFDRHRNRLVEHTTGIYAGNDWVEGVRDELLKWLEFSRDGYAIDKAKDNATNTAVTIPRIRTYAQQIIKKEITKKERFIIYRNMQGDHIALVRFVLKPKSILAAGFIVSPQARWEKKYLNETLVMGAISSLIEASKEYFGSVRVYANPYNQKIFDYLLSFQPMRPKKGLNEAIILFDDIAAKRYLEYVKQKIAELAEIGCSSSGEGRESAASPAGSNQSSLTIIPLFEPRSYSQRKIKGWNYFHSGSILGSPPWLTFQYTPLRRFVIAHLRAIHKALEGSDGKTARLLDVGSGMGILTREIAKELPDSYKVFSFDIAHILLVSYL